MIGNFIVMLIIPPFMLMANLCVRVLLLTIVFQGWCGRPDAKEVVAEYKEKLREVNKEGRRLFKTAIVGGNEKN